MPAETSLDPSARDSDSSYFGMWIRWLLIAGIFVAGFICLHYCVEIGSVEAKNREVSERSLAELARTDPKHFGQFAANSAAASSFPPKPLPPITEWVLNYRTIFMFVAIFIPMAALSTFALRDRSQMYGILLILGFLSAFESLVVYAAVKLPFIDHVVGVIPAHSLRVFTATSFPLPENE